MGSDAPKTDWERIEAEYRTGKLSVSEIGRQYGVSHTAINKRAKKEGWVRDLSEKVRKLVSARLVSEGVSASTLSETVEKAAERDIQIVRQHRADIGEQRRLVGDLVSELRESTSFRLEIEEAIEEETASDKSPRRRDQMLRAVGLASRVGVMKDLAAATKTLIELERQAFNIGAGDPTGGSLSDLLQQISGTAFRPTEE
jgi:transposase-like protein